MKIQYTKNEHLFMIHIVIWIMVHSIICLYTSNKTQDTILDIEIRGIVKLEMTLQKY